jgi:septum formation protein
MSIILASASPQRKKLLEQIGIEFTAIPSMVDENMSDDLLPDEQVKEIALKKAQWVAERNTGFDIIIGADTMVAYQDRILGKPHNIEEAEEMLQLLSGTTHRVLTGLAIITPNKTLLDVVSTEVRMKSLNKNEMQNYLSTGEPIGKAGAVCIQGIGAKFITGINGCFYNVVGLPLERLVEMLKEAEGYDTNGNSPQKIRKTRKG